MLEQKIQLRNGVQIPTLGLGTWQIPDEIAQKSDIPIHYVLSSLTMLEIKGVIKSSSGQGYKLNID